MALTYTPDPLEAGTLGSIAQPFSLPGTDGQVYSLNQTPHGSGTLVMFICNHCPYVIAIEDRLVALGKKYLKSGIRIFAISSNDSDVKPADSFEKMKEKNYPFPYLYDETQKIARAYDAVCTPDFFLFDSSMKLVYRGRLDDSWKDSSLVKSQDLSLAMDELLSGNTPSINQKPSMGCSIKWKAERA